MTRTFTLALTVCVACFAVVAALAQDPVPAAASEQTPAQQVKPGHPDEEVAGPGPYQFPFRIVYLRKDGNWGSDDCITVFPDPAEIYSAPGKKPNRIWWVVLGKEEGHVWRMVAKEGSDEDDLPPYPREIPKDKPVNTFWTSAVTHKEKDYDWSYKITLTEVDDSGNATNNSCILDPKVQVKG